MKVDFGVYINGWIVDSVFIMFFDFMYDDFFVVVKDVMDIGIRVICYFGIFFSGG